MTVLPFGTSTDHVFPGRATSTTSTAPPPATATHILPPPTAATTAPCRASVASATTCHLSSSHLYALTSPLTSSTTYISPWSAGGGAATGPVHPRSSLHIHHAEFSSCGHSIDGLTAESSIRERRNRFPAAGCRAAGGFPSLRRSSDIRAVGGADTTCDVNGASRRSGGAPAAWMAEKGADYPAARDRVES
ncbi:hypothetical protein IEQ34_018928 [Dendrobium chrysotoxum]|uniref:Uncharacterized protein n=1 Tax=Dendrobium chrysotoxum TaxID=161865 RepID=A0AAV7G6M5_DENCH|nr:hypothetical protein IEQ34_018928 [Dendrobium chrysotoxum]